MLSVNEISGFLESRRNEMVDLLIKLAEAESPSTQPESQVKILSVLREVLSALDYEGTIVKGRRTGGYLYARPVDRPKGKPLQLLLGHCDTVWPVDTLATMPVEKIDNRVKGPGVYDMKGGLVQMIYALGVLKHFNTQPPVIPLVLINSDEETGSHESNAAISRLAKIVDRAFVLEPSIGLEGKLKTARKGVGRFTIIVRGRAAHAGLDPQKGINAIVELSYLIQQLFKMNDAEKGISVNIGMVEGGIRPNVVAPESRAVIDVRVPTEAEALRLESEILKLQPQHGEVEVEIKGQFGRRPMEATPRNMKLWDVAKAAGSALGIGLESMTAGGASDGNTTSLYTATLDGLGATGDGAHARHEFVIVDKLIERAALLTLLLLGDPLNTNKSRNE